MELILDQIGQSEHQKKVFDLISQETEKIQIVSPYISGNDGINLDFLVQCKEVDVICNLFSGNCNPNTIKEMIKNTGINVKTRSDIHAKVYLFGGKAVLGSANLTPNGMGSGNIDASVDVPEEANVEHLYKWFEDLWKDGGSKDVKTLSESEWDLIQARWDNKRRKAGDRKGIKEKSHFYDLLLEHDLSNVVFGLCVDFKVKIQDSDVDKDVENKQLDLPNNWSYWVETDDQNLQTIEENEAILDRILNKYKGYICLAVYADWDKKSNEYKKFYKVNFYPVRLMNKYSRLKCDINKYSLVSYYETMPLMPFQARPRDVKTLRFIERLNESLKTQRKEWKKFLNTEEGDWGYFSIDKINKILGI